MLACKSWIAIHFKYKTLTIILILSITIISCGIDTINYLSEDPVSVSSDGTSSFIFSIKKAGSLNYYGAQLFYRIYASPTDADSDKSYIIAKQNETNSVPGSLIESQLISSSGLRYLSPAVNNQTNSPTILRDDVLNENDYINLSFPVSSEPSYYIDSKYTIFNTLKRNATDSSGEYKTFIDEPPSTSDPDYKSSSDDEDSAYYIQFYAAAYGFSDSWEVLYGDAIYLGRISLYY